MAQVLSGEPDDVWTHPSAGAPPPPPSGPDGRHLPHRGRRLRIRRFDRRLAQHPLLEGLTRSQLATWSKAADEVEIAAGDPLLMEDRIGYWCFLISAGEAELT